MLTKSPINDVRANIGRLNSESGRIGSSARRSWIRNSTASITAAPKAAITHESLQPRRPPSIRAAARTPSEPMAAACPSKSSLRLTRGVSVTCRQVTHRPPRPIGRFDEKDAPPSRQRNQCAAHGRPCSKRDAASPHPPAYGAAPRFGPGIGVVEQRQRVWHHDRCANALHSAGCNQDCGCWRQSRSQRSGRE